MNLWDTALGVSQVIKLELHSNIPIEMTSLNLRNPIVCPFNRMHHKDLFIPQV